MKEPLKEQERNLARAKFINEKKQRNSFDEKSDAKNIGHLHRKFVEHFDNDEKGWELLQSIDAKILLGIENKYLREKMSLNSAVVLLLKASRCAK